MRKGVINKETLGFNRATNNYLLSFKLEVNVSKFPIVAICKCSGFLAFLSFKYKHISIHLLVKSRFAECAKDLDFIIKEDS